MAKLTVKELDESVMRVLDEIEGGGEKQGKPNILKRLQDKLLMNRTPEVKPENKL